MYLDLLERALLHTLYFPPDVAEMPAYSREPFRAAVEAQAGGDPQGEPGEGIDMAQQRLQGRDWPKYAQTMIGIRRLRNVRRCVQSAIDDRVPGDMIEAGCWRGGAAIMMRGVLEANGDRDRTVWAADSFEGLPEPNAELYPADEGDLNFTAEQLAVPLEEVRGNFERYGLLDDRVRFLEGWFKDTLQTVADRKWAVIRLDGDLYESTMDSLRNLYPGLSVGGYVIIDDYGWTNCRAAVEDYRSENGITEEIVEIDWTGAYWRRTT
jgi:O-methyltransferase